jgi:hypothetical protein
VVLHCCIFVVAYCLVSLVYCFAYILVVAYSLAGKLAAGRMSLQKPGSFVEMARLAAVLKTPGDCGRHPLF